MNCGPLALMEAERFLCPNLFEDTNFKYDSTLCNLYRQNFGNFLHNMTGALRGECKRWCHEICLKGCCLKTTFTCQHH
ncbi:unnamed protein product [Clavelina lepadiformis]|uniref:Uncharacterized protein n=1 Tax=Clavelina lepadiformis TaxID=159417 RepID=A0ABP0GEN7_CLALP